MTWTENRHGQTHGSRINIQFSCGYSVGLEANQFTICNSETRFLYYIFLYTCSLQAPIDSNWDDIVPRQSSTCEKQRICSTLCNICQNNYYFLVYSSVFSSFINAIWGRCCKLLHSTNIHCCFHEPNNEHNIVALLYENREINIRSWMKRSE